MVGVSRRKGTGRWQAYYRDPSGRQRSKDFDRKRDAVQWEQQKRRELLTGTWLNPDDARITLDEVYQQWLPHKENAIKPSTFASYRENYKNLIAPTFGNTPIGKITSSTVLTWQTKLVARVSTSRARRARSILGQILDMAMLDRRISNNPVTSLPKSLLVKNSDPPRDHIYLTAPEAEALADASGSHCTLIRVLAYTGLRWGEAIGLRRRDVDLARRRLKVQRSFSTTAGKPRLTTTKTSERREVPIPQSLADQLQHAMIGKKPDDLLFGDGTKPLDVNNFRRRVFKPAVKASGVDHQLRIHDLRHTAASLAIQRGASVLVVQRMLGHSTPTMTLNVYTGLFDSDLDSAFTAFDDADPGLPADSVLTDAEEHRDDSDDPSLGIAS